MQYYNKMLAYECVINRKNREYTEKLTNTIFFNAIIERDKRNNKTLVDDKWNSS